MDSRIPGVPKVKKLLSLSLDYIANATMFGCPIRKRKIEYTREWTKKQRDERTQLFKNLEMEMPTSKKIVIHEERYLTLVHNATKTVRAGHREEVVSRCHFELVKAARRYELKGDTEAGFVKYASVCLKYVVVHYFKEMAEHPDSLDEIDADVDNRISERRD